MNTTPHLTVDDVNKELTKVQRALAEYNTLPAGSLFTWKEAILLAGKKERKDIESWAVSGPLMPPFDVFKECFGINIIWVDADSYFDLVFTAPRLEKKS